MPQNNINTSALQNFINQVKAADLGHQKEVKLSITDAKALSYTLSVIMARLIGDYEGLIQKMPNDSTPDVKVQMDGGSWDKK